MSAEALRLHWDGMPGAGGQAIAEWAQSKRVGGSEAKT